MPEDFDLILAADVRALAPPMRPQFRAELDDKVARGFKSSGDSASRFRFMLSRRMLMPAMGIAATLIVALVVAATTLNQRGAHDAVYSVNAGVDLNKHTPVRPPSVSVQSDEVAPTAAGAASAAAPAPTLQRQLKSAAPGFGRKVEHNTELTLSTPNKNLQDVSDGVVHVTQGVGGIVERSNVDSSDEGGTASFTLSIPSGRLADAIKQLSKLAHVSSMSQGATDITKSFVSAASELSDARAERKALLKALGVAKTPERIATLKARLRDNRSEIANYNGQLNSLRRRTNNTTVRVTVNGDGTAPSSSGGGWKFRDAANDTLKVLEVVAAVIMISAAILIPLAILGALAAFAMRGVTRRRREQALQG